MSGFRLAIALVIVIVIVLLGIFYYDLKGYEKVERINEWVLYYCEECDEDKTQYDGYILINGFEELSFDEALENDYFTEEIDQEIMSLIESRE